MTNLAFFETTATDHVAAGAPGVYELSPSVVMLSQPAGAPAESIRGMRAHLAVQHIEAGRRALAVCAPVRQSGCTFVAVNLAVALSQVGVRTLLVDAALRVPTVDKMIKPRQAVRGLHWALEQPDADYLDCIDLEVLPHFSVVFAGDVTPHAGELLAGARFEAVMNDCFREFDCTIIDTPPANVAAETRRIAAVAGHALLVARQHRTHVADLKTLAEQLESDHVAIAGSVLNEA